MGLISPAGRHGDASDGAELPCLGGSVLFHTYPCVFTPL